MNLIFTFMLPWKQKVFFLKFVIIQFNFNPISDFSLVNWMTEKGLATNEPYLHFYVAMETKCFFQSL
jgi:hypothetical protein